MTIEQPIYPEVETVKKNGALATLAFWQQSRQVIAARFIKELDAYADLIRAVSVILNKRSA